MNEAVSVVFPLPHFPTKAIFIFFYAIIYCYQSSESKFQRVEFDVEVGEITVFLQGSPEICRLFRHRSEKLNGIFDTRNVHGEDFA